MLYIEQRDNMGCMARGGVSHEVLVALPKHSYTFLAAHELVVAARQVLFL